MPADQHHQQQQSYGGHGHHNLNAVDPFSLPTPSIPLLPSSSQHHHHHHHQQFNNNHTNYNTNSVTPPPNASSSSSSTTPQPSISPVATPMALTSFSDRDDPQQQQQQQPQQAFTFHPLPINNQNQNHPNNQNNNNNNNNSKKRKKRKKLVRASSILKLIQGFNEPVTERQHGGKTNEKHVLPRQVIQLCLDRLPENSDPTVLSVRASVVGFNRQTRSKIILGHMGDKRFEKKLEFSNSNATTIQNSSPVSAASRETSATAEIWIATFDDLIVRFSSHNNGQKLWLRFQLLDADQQVVCHVDSHSFETITTRGLEKIRARSSGSGSSSSSSNNNNNTSNSNASGEPPQKKKKTTNDVEEENRVEASTKNVTIPMTTTTTMAVHPSSSSSSSSSESAHHHVQQQKPPQTQTQSQPMTNELRRQDTEEEEARVTVGEHQLRREVVAVAEEENENVHEREQRRVVVDDRRNLGHISSSLDLSSSSSSSSSSRISVVRYCSPCMGFVHVRTLVKIMGHGFSVTDSRTLSCREKQNLHAKKVTVLFGDRESPQIYRVHPNFIVCETPDTCHRGKVNVRVVLHDDDDGNTATSSHDEPVGRQRTVSIMETSGAATFEFLDAGERDRLQQMLLSQSSSISCPQSGIPSRSAFQNQR